MSESEYRLTHFFIVQKRARTGVIYCSGISALKRYETRS